MRATLFHVALLAVFAPALAHAAPTVCTGDQCKGFINDGPPSTGGCCGPLPAITKTLQIATGGCEKIDGAKVHVSITHEWVGDLVVSITAPNGVTKQLINRFGSLVAANGCPGEDIDASFTDSATTEGTCAQTIPALSGDLIPVQELAPLDGAAANGIWTLTVSDAAGGRHGALRSWSVDPCAGSPMAGANEATIFTVADATIGGGDSGRLAIVRNAPYLQTLTIEYTTSGTAPAGTFVPLTGSVTIPAGEPAAFVDVTPVSTAIAGTTVVATLTAGAAAVGTPGAATVTFVTSAPTAPTGTITPPEEEPEEQPEPSTPKSGCGCRASASESLPLAALVLSVLVLRRRRGD